MSTTFQWTLADYDRMVQAGMFDGPKRRRVEFIRGEVLEMSPVGPLHVEVVMRLNRWSCRVLPEEQASISVRSPVRLAGLESAPEPDLAWLAPRDYSRALPDAGDILLLVEVADTSLEYDAGEKAHLYAAAGIADYWLVDLAGRVVEVRREPMGGRYRSLKTCAGEDEVRPLAFPEAVLRPSALF